MKKLGRAFNHLEDLVFFYGSDGIREAFTHIDEICNDSSTVRMKWDGGLQIYWGREYKNGPLIFTGHNGWARGIKSTKPAELYDFIVNQSGKDRDNASEQRKEFANKFSSLFSLFDEATPQDFVGFVYADALFLEKPTLLGDKYHFQPNHTAYNVHKNSILGKKIDKSNILLVGHAYFNSFGQKDDEQIPLENFDKFNTDKLLILNPFYSKVPISIQLQTGKDIVIKYGSHIDEFLAPISGVSAFRDYIYRYTNYKMKNNLNIDLLSWIMQSTISSTQQEKIKNRIIEQSYGFKLTMHAIDIIMSIKNNIIQQLEQNTHEVRAHNPEGWVRYSDNTKKFGNIKLVPRHLWTP